MREITKGWVIRADYEVDDNGAPLYWQMDFGWASFESLTIRDIFPANTGLVWLGKWQSYSDAEKEVNNFKTSK